MSISRVNTNIRIGKREDMIQSAVEATDGDLLSSFAEYDQITSQQLFSHLFEACNILRGPINQDEFKSYVIPILFFKRLSDVYDEETIKALEESGGDEEFASFPENHRFIIPDGCHWNDVRTASENVGRAIVNAMSNIGSTEKSPKLLMRLLESVLSQKRTPAQNGAKRLSPVC